MGKGRVVKKTERVKMGKTGERRGQLERVRNAEVEARPFPVSVLTGIVPLV